jgi:hypothetical protein
MPSAAPAAAADAAAAAAAAEAEKKRRGAEFAFISQHAEKMIWTTDPVECFVPARVLKELPNGDMELEVGASAVVKTVKKADLGAWILNSADLRVGFEDMVRMTDVNEATILHNLRIRFMQDEIYTNIGTILVSINPFKWMPHLYASNLVDEHFNTPPGEVSSPHVFQIAAAAYLGLRGERLDQSIIISGESGAGKTEATKQCLKFFAEAAGSVTKGMSEKLLSANPILEAFGNAKTVRNNNSSRFGKWMEVNFNGRAQICGSQIINYLLEKSRVVFQANSERNYHIFYMLPIAATPEQRARFALTRPEEYAYTNRSSSIIVEGLDDAGEYKELLHAFSLVEIREEEYDPLLQIVAGLLHLSNLVFESPDPDSSRIVANPHNTQELGHAARLLGVDTPALQRCMEQKLIETRSERVWSPLTVEKAVDSRNAMAKAMYGRMFDWLVQRVNQAMEGSLKLSENVIGVLDIFGFEIFERNSFEQLCINYCNEKLQQHFNYHVFKLEEKCYKAEEIDYSEIKFEDNQDVLDLVEKKPEGLLPKLDDECKVPRGSDQGYLEKIQKMHADNPRFRGRVAGKRDRDGEFGVNHYAGTVYYNVTAFCEKNKDEVLLNIRELMASSSLPLIPYLFSDEAREATAAARGAGKANADGGPGSPAPAKAGATGGSDKQTQSTQFRGQLDSLMKTLNSTEPHYIRCIKPNSVKKGNIFEAPICLQQLRYAGVFEAVRVRQLGFPFRWTYDAFFKRYRYAARDASLKARIAPGGFPWRDKCKLLLDNLATHIAPTELSPVAKLFKFGKTMVLYRADQARVLEMIRDHVRTQAAIHCERVYRGHRVRLLYRRLRAAQLRFRAAIAARLLAGVQAAIAEARTLPFRLFVVGALETLEARLLEEKACAERLATLYPLDPADNYAAYEGALKDARRLELTDPIVAKAQAKFATVKDRIETKANLKRGIEIGDKALILRSLAKAEELKKDWGDIVPAAQLDAAQQMLAVIALEERVQDNLKLALKSGGPKGAIGALDASMCDTAALDQAVADATSGRVAIKTAFGANLIATCRKLRDLRAALKSQVWVQIEGAVAALVQLRAEDRLVEDAEAEVRMAEGELADRRIQNELVGVLSSGAPRGAVGELDVRSADTTQLAAAIARTKESAEHVGGLSPTAQHLLASAELILRLRHAMVAADWSSMKKTVNEGLEARLSKECLAEVLVAKAELDNHVIIHQLTDALERGGASGPVARLDLGGVDVAVLSERIANAEDIGPKTAQANALLKLARIVKRLREALLERRLDAVPQIVAEASQAVPAEFVPAGATAELLTARYEGENVTIVRTLSQALTGGAVRGTVGFPDVSAVDTAALSDALQTARTLKCRSAEAVWLFEVAESLVALRKAFKDAQWASLQDLVYAVMGMDGSRPNERGAASMAAAGSLTHHAHAYFSRASALHANADGGAGGGAFPPLNRSRGSSQDKRPAFLRAATAPGSGSSAASPVAGAGVAMTTPIGAARSGRRTSIVGASLLPGGLASVIAAAESKLSPEKDEHFYLPAEVRAEVALILDELNNHTTISELTSKLAQGGPQGELGALDASAVELDGLSIALKRAQRTGIKTPLAAALFYTGQVVRDLRQCLHDKDWALVDSTLRHVAVNNARIARTIGFPVPPGQPPSLPTAALPVVDVPAAASPAALEQASITLVSPGLVEVIRVEAEVQYRRVMEQMTGALAAGAAEGVVGKIEAGSCDVGRLAAAIDAARALGSRTKQSRHLTALCRLLWQMRTAVMEDDWPSVESLLVAGAAVLGTAAGQTEEDRAAVPAAVCAETDLYRAEAYNRRIVETFRSALRTKQATGEIGRLNLGEVDGKPLEDALRLAMTLGTKTPEARCLLATALQVRAMRLALLGGSWTRLGELLDYYFAAEAKTKPYTRYGAGSAPLSATAAGGPTSVLSGGGASSSAAASRPFSTTNTKDGVGSMATWPGVLEAADGYDLAVDGVAAESAQEAHILQLELNNRNIIVELTKSCSSGAALGGIGKLDVSALRTGELDWAIEYAARVGCITLEAEQVLATAVVLRKVRMALGTGNWTALDEALAGARGKELADVGATEIQQAQDELDNRVILSELVSALAKGRPQGRVGRIYTGSIDLKPLNDALALAQKLGPKTQEAKQMLFTAKVVARLRMCLLNADMPEAALTLEAVNGKPLASVAIAEIRAVEDEVNNWTVLSELGASLAKGGPAGGVGHLDLSAVDTAGLVAALNHADALGVKTTEASTLYAAAAQAYKLRTALLADNWGSGAEAGAGPDASSSSSSSSPAGVEAILRECDELPLSDLVSAELDLLRGEVNNRRIVLSLAQALARGAAKGPVGEMDVSEVDTAELDVAIAQASELGTRTEDAERLLLAAKAVRRLRSVLLSGNWQWVGSVLLEARQTKHIFPPVSLKELQQAQDELDNKAILAQVNGALRKGVPTGSIGHVDPDSVDVAVLDEALGYARTLGVKSTEASAAVAAAQLVRRLRVAVKANDWAEAKEALEGALKGRSLPPAAADELQFVRLCVDNWQVIQDLSIAAATGGPVGPLGDPDLRALRVDALDAAIALASRLGCHTVEARRCLVSALIVRRLRSALLDGDHAFLAHVLAEAAAEADAILPQCRAELAYARETLDFRGCMEDLARASAAQDETALVETLSRAQRLRLPDHPRAHVKQTLETATLILTRLQRCKASLAAGIRGMDAPGLVDALSMAAGMGFTHSLVEEGRRVLSRVQDMTDRAGAALRAMDAVAMATVLRDCGTIGLNLPVLADIRRALSLPRGEFLRRELDAVLAAIAGGTASADFAAVAGSSGPASSPNASAPSSSSSSSSSHARAPTPLELRLINCTVQIKDLFFGDAPDSDEVIAAALGGAGTLLPPPATPGASPMAGLLAGASSGSPGKQQLQALLASNPQAAAAIATLRAQRNTDDNVRGAQIRLSPTAVLQQAANPAFLFAGPGSGLFRPEGYARPSPAQQQQQQQVMASATTSSSSSPVPGLVVGSTTPPLHSSLRRQFALDKFGRIKPPHMFSTRFPPSLSLAQSGLLRFQTDPLHTSLTLLQSADARRAAVKTFRNILAFMGDRPLSKPVALGQEVLALGHAVPELRDEILLQLLKQLSGNPSIASASRGWVLLYLCLSTFHPSDEFENHLELWLREAGAVPCVWALHLTQYRGGPPAAAGVPAAADISYALERARAPPLPNFVQDADTAGTLAEYASVSRGEHGEASGSNAALGSTLVVPASAVTRRTPPGRLGMESKTAEGKDAEMALTAPPGGMSALVGSAASALRLDFDRDAADDHATQLALLQSLTARAKAGGSNAPPAAPEPPKRVTPTKPIGGAFAAAQPSAAAAYTSGSAASAIAPPPVPAPAPRLSAAPAPNRPPTPTKPGATAAGPEAGGILALIAPLPPAAAAAAYAQAPAPATAASAALMALAQSSGYGGPIGSIAARPGSGAQLAPDLVALFDSISRQVEKY